MAEIRVQEKKGPSPWLWIIGLVAVAVLIWLFTGLSGDDDEFATESGETIDTIAAPAETGIAGGTAIEGEDAETEDYLAFVRETSAADAAGREHAYVVEGLRKLTAALDADAGLETVREAVDRLEESETDATLHAGLTREAFLAVAESMESMQATGDIASLRQAAEAIQPDQPLLDQTADVEAFFTTAAELLSGVTTS